MKGGNSFRQPTSVMTDVRVVETEGYEVNVTTDADFCDDWKRPKTAGVEKDETNLLLLPLGLREPGRNKSADMTGDEIWPMSSNAQPESCGSYQLWNEVTARTSCSKTEERTLPMREVKGGDESSQRLWCNGRLRKQGMRLTAMYMTRIFNKRAMRNVTIPEGFCVPAECGAVSEHLGLNKIPDVTGGEVWPVSSNAQPESYGTCQLWNKGTVRVSCSKDRERVLPMKEVKGDVESSQRPWSTRQSHKLDMRLTAMCVTMLHRGSHA